MRHVRTALLAAAAIAAASSLSLRALAGPDDTVIQWSFQPEESGPDSTVTLTLDVDDPDGVVSIELVAFQNCDGTQGYDPDYDVLLSQELRPYVGNPVHVEDATFVVAIPPDAESGYHFEARVVDGATFLAAATTIKSDVQLGDSYFGDNGVPGRIKGWLRVSFSKTISHKDQCHIHATQGCKFSIAGVWWPDGTFTAVDPPVVVDGGTSTQGDDKYIVRQ